ncbi:hypothetical protein ABIF07_000004 [Bradyrhizobium elkanii]|jgi:hypothetical protein|uniref:hypothetical protein n=1 Tax=Bradyrhizobium elkanii TaxID=29448 RepID=UPI00216A909C|nr:hypothetical protein [Bradyrhizobium elkanii]MCS3695113.1 hypothetical protein [Bradyrhizobium elkanii]
MAVTWDTIKAYFTDMDVDHMKHVSANWPKVLDLHDEASVLYYATQVQASVASGRMPIGEPRWTPKMVADFLDWWQSQVPGAMPIV